MHLIRQCVNEQIGQSKLVFDDLDPAHARAVAHLQNVNTGLQKAEIKGLIAYMTLCKNLSAGKIEQLIRTLAAMRRNIQHLTERIGIHLWRFTVGHCIHGIKLGIPVIVIVPYVLRNGIQ